MKVEKQVCTLQQAKKLKELGVEQKSIFTWCVFMPSPIGEDWFYAPVYFQEDIEKVLTEDIASAYSIPELAKMIKGGTYEAERLWNRMLSRINGGNSCIAFYNASFLAEFLIEILEAKYLSVEACNERLLA